MHAAVRVALPYWAWITAQAVWETVIATQRDTEAGICDGIGRFKLRYISPDTTDARSHSRWFGGA